MNYRVHDEDVDSIITLLFFVMLGQNVESGNVKRRIRHGHGPIDQNQARSWLEAGH